MSTFICYYCGQHTNACSSSGEHIIASGIGGNRNVTLTDQVCAECNDRAGREIDLPFCRDWFIEATRFIAGLSHRGKPPVWFRGRLTWQRREVVRVYEVAGGGTLLAIDAADETLLAVIVDPESPIAIRNVKRIIKARFEGLRVINGSSPRRAYDDELVSALEALPPTWDLRFEIDTFAWHRAIVKMALGLASQTFGHDFVVSSAAARLRQYLWEQDPVRRNALDLHGRGGALVSKPTITSVIHPGGDEHLFALVSTGSGLCLAANLFGRFENIVRIDEGEQFAERLPVDPAGVLRGVGWIVEPIRKVTTGPIPIGALIVASVDRERAAHERSSQDVDHGDSLGPTTSP